MGSDDLKCFDERVYSLANQLRDMFDRIGIALEQAFNAMTLLTVQESVMGGMTPDVYDGFLDLQRRLFLDAYTAKLEDEQK